MSLYASDRWQSGDLAESGDRQRVSPALARAFALGVLTAVKWQIFHAALWRNTQCA